MSDLSSQGSAASTSDSNEQAIASPGNANETNGGDSSSQSASPDSSFGKTSRTSRPTSSTARLYVSNQRREVREMDVAPSLTEPGGLTQTPFLLISSAEGSPAKTSPSPADAPDSPGNAPASSSTSHGSPMSLFSPEGMSSLRTYPDFFPATVDEISPSYSRRWPSSGFTTSPGECWTADTSECPNAGAGSSSLADVLEEIVAPKYFLSPKAAAGILRRAEKRGRSLPSHLSAALEAVARTTTTDKAEG